MKKINNTHTDGTLPKSNYDNRTVACTNCAAVFIQRKTYINIEKGDFKIALIKIYRLKICVFIQCK